MEILTTYENNDNISKNKSYYFRDPNNSLDYFTNSSKTIFNNSNLTLRILQDIKRRDEIRELYNNHKKNEKKKINININNNNNNNNNNKIHEFVYDSNIKLSENENNDRKNENTNAEETSNNDENTKIYKISKRMQSADPMPLPVIDENKGYKPIFPKGKQCARLLPSFIETTEQDSFYISEDPIEELESNINKNHDFEPYTVYNEYWNEIPTPRSINNNAPPLIFDSRFESGNLSKAIRIDDFSYFLQLKTDFNTNGHTQWFFFQVKNMLGNHEYQFTLGNFTKPKSLFNNGMQVLMYSKKKEQKENIGWYRTGYNISYTKNKKSSNVKCTYLLDITIIFPEHNDTCYIAYCYPYTYSDLQKDIKELKKINEICNIFSHEVIGESLIKNNIDLLTITNNEINNENKKVIIVTGRVHPSESNSSFIIKVNIRNSKEAKYLRDNYIVKIIPMLNPDGVITGNSRCSLTGYDLNRCWRLTDKKLLKYSPEIYYVIKMIEKTFETNDIEMFVDFHGHSRKFGTFLYGCNNDNNDENRFKERVFPYIFSTHNKDYVFYNRCHFNIEKIKEGTGRITMKKKYNVLKSYTMETSICGSDLTSTKGFHYSIKELGKIGKSFGKTMSLYFKNKYEDSNYEKIILNDIRLYTKDKNNDDDGFESSDMSSDDENTRKAKKREQKLKKIEKLQKLEKLDKLKKNEKLEEYSLNEYSNLNDEIKILRTSNKSENTEKNKEFSLNNNNNNEYIGLSSIVNDDYKYLNRYIEKRNKNYYATYDNNSRNIPIFSNKANNNESNNNKYDDKNNRNKKNNKKDINSNNEKKEPTQYVALTPKTFVFNENLIITRSKYPNHNKKQLKDNKLSPGSKIYYSNPNINNGLNLYSDSVYDIDKINKISGSKSAVYTNISSRSNLYSQNIKSKSRKSYYVNKNLNTSSSLTLSVSSKTSNSSLPDSSSIKALNSSVSTSSSLKTSKYTNEKEKNVSLSSSINEDSSSSIKLKKLIKENNKKISKSNKVKQKSSSIISKSTNSLHQSSDNLIIQNSEKKKHTKLKNCKSSSSSSLSKSKIQSKKESSNKKNIKKKK
ncbi:hypothetical protein BCR32DRAFT_284114 [Anaeromyces robustus]|uniref:Peptidase M14 domain-containing protein n=1 Tax=Anaeromyces robustus TaxID=1754192 RepID=A0A1Y1WSI7_9FUNG|nr:hypothetical protein BCR32DRAFT_284114 [Anaeromyces robustus]|eukprot:ORX76497.1 hypothetical protein BCR32DRAFT_284114 [Anaeromyces robustus]